MTYRPITWVILGVIGVGFRCRPLAPAGTVSAAEVTDRKRDVFGLTVTDFKATQFRFSPKDENVWIPRSTVNGVGVYTPLQTDWGRQNPIYNLRGGWRSGQRFYVALGHGLDFASQHLVIGERVTGFLHARTQSHLITDWVNNETAPTPPGQQRTLPRYSTRNRGKRRVMPRYLWISLFTITGSNIKNDREKMIEKKLN